MIVGFARLQRLTGYKRASPIVDWLKSQRIQYLRDPKGRPFTTLEAINRAMEGRRKGQGQEWQPDYAAAAARRKRPG